MRGKLFNEGWTFLLQPYGTDFEKICTKRALFNPVNLPHDWQIYHGKKLYEDGTGWYRKIFTCHPEQEKYYEIYFEGVYMDSLVYLNGHKIGEWKYGYSSFHFDLTPFLVAGENELMVCANVKHPNSRWYSGAGIYRNVYFRECHKSHFETDSLYVVTKKENDDLWKVKVTAGVAQFDTLGEQQTRYLKLQIRDLQGRLLKEEKQDIGHDNILVSSIEEEAALKEEAKVTQVCIMTQVSQPKLWDIEKPNLYQCTLSLWQEDGCIDTIEEKIGFRTFDFSTTEGFFLNGRHVKLNGVCEHHDFGALGAAFYKAAMRRKLEILRKMGVNSIRSTHNMPAIGLLELCDEMGFLVIDEAFDMWEKPKTEYDYARFFKAWYKTDVKSWITRDRNHPCILFWSIGNEIYDTHADEHGLEITESLLAEVKKYDPDENAIVSIGSNYMPWENAKKCADVLKFAGYNYGETYYEEHHKEHPDWYIYGSETGSTVQSRGIYHFPYAQPLLADEDEQCSSLGNSTTSWGAKSSEYCILAERDTNFSMGQFIWTGFDYIGEPTPYHTRNSYFGQIDTAGFPKDSYYIYQSAWTTMEENPMVHIFPYWDFNPGQMIDIRVATNAPKVELLINGNSKGICTIDHAHGKVLTGNWKLPYEKGEVTAVSYTGDMEEVARETIHSFGNPKKLVIEPYDRKEEYTAGNYDLAYFNIYTVDENGHPVCNDNTSVEVKVEGAGWLTGLDNGDSTDEDEYKGYCRKLFSGKLLAIVAIGNETGSIKISATAKGLETAGYEIQVNKKEVLEGVSLLPEIFEASNTGSVEKNRIRKITLEADSGNQFTGENRTKIISARIDPPEIILQEKLIWKVINDAGVESNLAAIELVDDMDDQNKNAIRPNQKIKLTAIGDGNFRLRCSYKNGAKRVKVISELEFEAEGIGEALLNPYQFLSGALCLCFEGEIGNGNEHGVATARDGRTVVGYEKVDFGDFGSDEITIPIFELGGEPCPIQIWQGIPEKKDSVLLADVIYHKKSIWNTYQEETYSLLHRVSGIQTICFVLNQKIHIKGMIFTKQEKAYQKLFAANNDGLYGDQYEVCGQRVMNIGNNVTMEFSHMNFGQQVEHITLCGRTKNDHNTIHIQIVDEQTGEETRQMIEFPGCGGNTDIKDMQTVTFDIEKITGNKTIRFVFLPGSQFDFEWFRFS